jgi:Xaa-Pro aminopeptidase
MQKDFKLFKERRYKLVENIKKVYPNKKGIVVLFADFEQERYRFRQESSFYYLTGLEEPAVALVIDLDTKSVLYMPNYGEQRVKWASSVIDPTSNQFLKSCGLESIELLGEQCKGYTISSDCDVKNYAHLLELLKNRLADGNALFTLYSSNRYRQQRLLIDSLALELPQIRTSIVDISALIGSMRRTKDKIEIEAIEYAIQCTAAAHEVAAGIIGATVKEHEVQAALEFIFTEIGAQIAFPSIVASGKNSTILHYNANRSTLNKGDLVVVDIGADLEYYCGDLTRTYPVSGHFTKRQREVYSIVLQTQQHIEELAKPGYWLYNKDEPSKSLHHLAHAFLSKKGYSDYFTHGLGHFLGMDVHDVGDMAEPLREGDIITIEPGVYIPRENLGIRIEDNYLITKDGIVCLSEQLPKDPELIEEMMIEVDDEDDYEYEDCDDDCEDSCD